MYRDCNSVAKTKSWQYLGVCNFSLDLFYIENLLLIDGQRQVFAEIRKSGTMPLPFSDEILHVFVELFGARTICDRFPKNVLPRASRHREMIP